MQFISIGLVWCTGLICGTVLVLHDHPIIGMIFAVFPILLSTVSIKTRSLNKDKEQSR